MDAGRTSTIKAFGVFLVLTCLYLLVFNGVSSTDDEQLFAVLTQNLASGKGYSALPLLGNDRLQGKTGSVEPLHPILGIPFYLFAAKFSLGQAQILFILPMLYTAATASIIHLILLQQGFQQKTALLVSFGYGLGTIAFPYARMNFREPLAALFITSSFYFMIIAQKRKDEVRAILLAFFLSYLCVAGAILTKITTAVILPVLITAQIFGFFKFEKPVRRKLAWWFIGMLFLFTIVGIAAIRLLPVQSVSRFTLRFVDYIRYTLPRLPHDHFWQAIAGLIFSPGRGLFIYSPILLLAFFSPFVNKDKKWMIGFSALLLLAVSQALIYNDEWWGITWGTRALLPVLPLITLSAAPAIDSAMNTNHPRWKPVPYIILGLSILIQAGRLFTSDPAYIGWVTQETGRSFDSAIQWDLALTPFFRYPWLGLREILTDIFWFHLTDVDPELVVLFLSLVVLGMALGIFHLSDSHPRKWIPFVGAGLLLLAIGSLLSIARSDARYYSQIPAIDGAHDTLCNQATAADLVLIDYYLHPFWWYFSNFGCVQFNWAGLPYAHQTAIHASYFYPRLAETQDLIHSALQSGTVFLVTITQDDSVSYPEEFTESGFILRKVSENSIHPFLIYQVSK